ncbi:hypothetical protein, partial [Stenotrophomonas maltophilia]|uniref:hypothetical protein n=1 Tax=Stenotrophomonas maltophilia TaxID=40324 RepID=UPI0039C05A6A
SNPTLSASCLKEPLETGAFLFLQPSLPARLPVHLQRSILHDLLPNPALRLGLYPEYAASDADRAPEAASLDLSADKGGVHTGHLAHVIKR